MANPLFLEFNALTGGADGSLDSYDTTSLENNSHAVVNTGSIVYFYNYDSSSTTAESSPDVIQPDGIVTGRWLLVWSSIRAVEGTQGNIGGDWTLTSIINLLGGFGINFSDSPLNRPKIKDYSEPVYAKGNITGASVDFDIEDGQIQECTLTGNVTSSTFSNFPATGNEGSLILHINQGATAYSITWPSSVDWGGEGAPNISTINKTYDIVFTTYDAGTKVRGRYAGMFD